MKAIAIDDEPVALDVIKLLSEKVPFIQLEATFTNAFAALTYLQENNIDLLFLDIKMPDINGIDFLNSICNPPMVVFTTAFSEHAVQSFELDAIDYLLKPFSLARFLKACNKAQELLLLRRRTADSKEITSIFIKDGYEQIKVALDDILYLQAGGNYTQVHLTSNKIVSTRVSINELQTLLPYPKFIRTHRAFIIARDKINKFDRVQVNIHEHIIPIGATYAQCLQDFI